MISTHVHHRIIILSFLLLYASMQVRAQVNTEKLRRADTANGLAFDIGVRFGFASGNSEYLLIGSGFRLDLLGEHDRHFIVGNYEFKGAGQNHITNKGFLHARTIWPVAEELAAEGFGQVEFNESIMLQNRFLAGTGLRWRIAACRNEADRNSSLALFLGVGAMYEHEYYNSSPERLGFDLIRSTNYLAFYWEPGDKLDLTLVTYYQPSFSDPRNFRSISELTLSLKIVSELAFNIRFVHRYDSRPVASIRPNDFELNNGITYTLP